MSASSFDLERERLAAAGQLRPEHFDEFQRLAKTILYGPAFQLLFIDCADTVYRDRVIGALDSLLRVARLSSARLPLSKRVSDAAQFEKRLQSQAARVQVVHVLGAHAWFDSARWADLNQRRERLARNAAARLVLWLDSKSIVDVARFAEDLWAWRGGVYEFVIEPTAEAVVCGSYKPEAARDFVATDRLSMSERYRRLAELGSLLDSSREHPELQLPLLTELGDLLFTMGRYDELLPHLRNVELPAQRAVGDLRGRVFTTARIADALEALGRHDEALQVRREEQLPLAVQAGSAPWRVAALSDIARSLRRQGEFDAALQILQTQVMPEIERLGDERGRARTLDLVADVLQSQGELDDALRLRRDIVLPIYQKLEDHRARAHVLSGIADLLFEQGQGDEALRILRDEVLPLFQRDGNVRMRAFTLGSIADVLMERGQIDEALRIHREDELPLYEQLGDTVGRSLCLVCIARLLLKRRGPGDVAEAASLLRRAAPDAQRMQWRFGGEIDELLQRTNVQ